MASGFPALMIKQPESPLQQYGQAQQVASGQQQMQMQALQIQQEQQKIKDQHALTTAMTQWDGQDPKTLPMLVLKAGGSGPAAMQMSSTVLDMRVKASDLAKNDSITAQNQTETEAKLNDERRGRILNAVNQTDPTAKQTSWDQEVTAEEKAGKIQPGQISHTYPGDVQAKAFANQFALGSQLAKEAQEQQKLNIDAWKPAGGALVNTMTGEKIGGIKDVTQINHALDARWQVLHPGEKAPDEFHLQPNDGPQDFERVDKLMEATERGAATEAQRQIANAMRQQTFDLMKDKTDLQAVMGTDPKTGKQVLLPLPQAQKMGIQNPIKAESGIIEKAMAGRHWLELANKQGDPNGPPEEMGIMQLVNKLDKEGKLGVVASRYNEFMAGKYGSSDPDVSALRAKMGLSTTLLMQAHVGNRGSSQMLEHFEDLANQKKLDGPTLKAALGSEINYVQDRAMDPNPPDYSKQPGAAKPAAKVATKVLSMAQIQQAAKDHGVSVDEATKQAKSAGYQVQ
jgi:hypothetical protein